MNICDNYSFQNILILSYDKFTNSNSQGYSLNKLIPVQWQILLMSDGSFTQNLNSLTNENITVTLVSNYTIINSQYQIREVLLKNNQNNLAFAKSLWLQNKINVSKLKYQPVGQLLIKLKKDIYKEIHEIYYGYSTYLNILFNSNNKPIWGRKYTIYYQYKPIVTIQEFFSPKLINLF